MGPYKFKWVQYYFSAKCVGFESFDKVGPVILIEKKNENK
jgi:hypothetical protein